MARTGCQQRVCMLAILYERRLPPESAEPSGFRGPGELLAGQIPRPSRIAVAVILCQLRVDHASAFSEARPGGAPGAEQKVGRAFANAVRRKPLAWRTRVLCKLNGPRERC